MIIQKPVRDRTVVPASRRDAGARAGAGRPRSARDAHRRPSQPPCCRCHGHATHGHPRSARNTHHHPSQPPCRRCPGHAAHGRPRPGARGRAGSGGVHLDGRARRGRVENRSARWPRAPCTRSCCRRRAHRTHHATKPGEIFATPASRRLTSGGGSGSHTFGFATTPPTSPPRQKHIPIR